LISIDVQGQFRIGTSYFKIQHNDTMAAPSRLMEHNFIYLRGPGCGILTTWSSQLKY
jgi:hypothetical protein